MSQASRLRQTQPARVTGRLASTTSSPTMAGGANSRKQKSASEGRGTAWCSTSSYQPHTALPNPRHQRGGAEEHPGRAAGLQPGAGGGRQMAGRLPPLDARIPQARAAGQQRGGAESEVAHEDGDRLGSPAEGRADGVGGADQDEGELRQQGAAAAAAGVSSVARPGGGRQRRCRRPGPWRGLGAGRRRRPGVPPLPRVRRIRGERRGRRCLAPGGAVGAGGLGAGPSTGPAWGPLRGWSSRHPWRRGSRCRARPAVPGQLRRSPATRGFRWRVGMSAGAVPAARTAIRPLIVHSPVAPLVSGFRPPIGTIHQVRHSGT